MNTNLLRLGSKMASLRSAGSPGPAGLRPPSPPQSAQRLGLGQEPVRRVAVEGLSSPPPPVTHPFSGQSSVFNLLKISKAQTLPSPNTEFKLVETWRKVYRAYVCLNFLSVPKSEFYCA